MRAKTCCSAGRPCCHPLSSNASANGKACRSHPPTRSSLSGSPRNMCLLEAKSQRTERPRGKSMSVHMAAKPRDFQAETGIRTKRQDAKAVTRAFRQTNQAWSLFFFFFGLGEGGCRPWWGAQLLGLASHVVYCTWCVLRPRSSLRTYVCTAVALGVLHCPAHRQSTTQDLLQERKANTKYYRSAAQCA